MDLDHIKIDDNHLELIYSLVLCHKPKSVRCDRGLLVIQNDK